MFNVNNKKRLNYVNDVILVFLLLKYFTPFSDVSVVGFEQVNVSWLCVLLIKFFGCVI